MSLFLDSHKVPPSFAQETYTQYVNLDDGLELTGIQEMPIYVKKFYKTSKLKKMMSMKKLLLTQLL